MAIFVLTTITMIQPITLPLGHARRVTTTTNIPHRYLYRPLSVCTIGTHAHCKLYWQVMIRRA